MMKREPNQEIQSVLDFLQNKKLNGLQSATLAIAAAGVILSVEKNDNKFRSDALALTNLWVSFITARDCPEELS